MKVVLGEVGKATYKKSVHDSSYLTWAGFKKPDKRTKQFESYHDVICKIIWLYKPDVVNFGKYASRAVNKIGKYLSNISSTSYCEKPVWSKAIQYDKDDMIRILKTPKSKTRDLFKTISQKVAQAELDCAFTAYYNQKDTVNW